MTKHVVTGFGLPRRNLCHAGTVGLDNQRTTQLTYLLVSAAEVYPRKHHQLRADLTNVGIALTPS